MVDNVHEKKRMRFEKVQKMRGRVEMVDNKAAKEVVKLRSREDHTPISTSSAVSVKNTTKKRVVK